MLLSKLIDLINKGDSRFIKANIIEDVDIKNAASLDEASKNQIAFLEENNALRESLVESNVSAVITITKNFKHSCRKSKNCICWSFKFSIWKNYLRAKNR